MPPELEELDLDQPTGSVRRGQVELILDILENIPIDDVGNVDRIAAAVGARWSTTRKYLELVALIQAAPRVIVYRVKGTGKKMYRREPGTVRREITT